MMYFSRAKTLLVLGVCVLGALLCLPNLFPAPAPWVPWRHVTLGIDLRGGSYLLMQVDMAAIEAERLDSLADAARATLLHGDIGYQNLAAQPSQHRVFLHLRDPAQFDAGMAALQTLPRAVRDEFSVNALPNNNVAIILQAAALKTRGTEAVRQSIEIVRRRIDATGVVDPQITRQGDSRIVIELPGAGDPERIKQLLGTTAKMTFHMVDEAVQPGSVAPPGDLVLPDADHPNQTLAVHRHVDVDGSDLTDAQAGSDQQNGGWQVNFTFNSIGSRKFADITRANIGHRFAVVLDNRVITAPVIQSVIPNGQGRITGQNFDAQSTTDLSLLLRAGALPAPLQVVEERTVGPELGADSIRAGALSLAAGFLLVIGFMGTFYGLFGWYANIALVVNLVLMVGILSLFQSALTLPGMAGLLLTLGHGGGRQYPDQ